MRWRVSLVAVLVLSALLLGACGNNKRIDVAWRVMKSNPGVLTIEVDGMRHGYQTSTVDGNWVEVEARLVGAPRTKPFMFEVAGEQGPIHWDPITDASIRIHTTEAGRGTVTITYEDLQTIVPFVIHPVIVLTTDTALEQGEANGISFATGQTHTSEQGDLYMQINGPRRFYAPYGYATQPKEDFWGGFREPMDVRSLSYSPPNADFEPQLKTLYTVKTADGGFAQFFISAARYGPATASRYNLIWRYSPTGIFE